MATELCCKKCMKNFTKHIQNTNALHQLWNRGDTILVGVSGGRDSMCLLHVLLKIAAKEDLRIVVAHVNYGLRGEQSLRDQGIVEDFCIKNDVICDTLTVAENARGENEADWRATRRSFFAERASHHEADRIALGHHQDDQAETLLLHLLRGSGLQGLASMRFRSLQKLSITDQADTQQMYTVIRPFLAVGRDDISMYCIDYEILFGEDESNSDTTFLRNKTRHELIPYLKEHYNQDIIKTLSRSAQIIGDDYSLLEESALPEYEHVGSTITFSRTAFNELSESAQRFYLRRVIGQLTAAQKHCGFGVIEEARKAIRSSKNKIQKIQTKDLIFCVKNATVEITLVG